MKISKESYSHIEQTINAWMLTQPDILSKYESGQFPKSDKVKDLQKRFCWDVALFSGLNGFICDLYRQENLNDAHVLTALKKILPSITRKY